jgi:beta-N-acetylhexosaminidase
VRAHRSRRLRALLVSVAVAGCCLAGAACGNKPSAAPTPSVTTAAATTPGATTPGATTQAGTPSPAISSRAETPSAQPTAGRRNGSPTPAPTPNRSRCADLAESLSLRDQVGQLMMVAVSSGGVSTAAATAIEDSRAGSVILLGNTTAGAARVRAVTEQARAAARTPKDIETMLAADQEGGQVQRLQGKGFDRIPSAWRQARDSPAELESDAARWGRQLKRAGIDANLAPVADVVPKGMSDVNQPIGVLRRGYGFRPATVGSHVVAFVEGMDAAGVATAVKHFPGLGRVRGNTDFTAEVVDDRTTRDDPYLEPFQDGVDAGTDMVMMSSAYYTRVDPKRRAAFSPTVIGGMVRGDLRFTGVVISDDLAAAAMQDLEPGERMLRFLRAGGDLAIVGDPSIAGGMADAVVAEARHDDDLAADIQTATVRVLQLKDRRGLADC